MACLLDPQESHIFHGRLWTPLETYHRKMACAVWFHHYPWAFQLRDSYGFISVMTLRIIHDFLITENHQLIVFFGSSLSSRFTVDRFVCDKQLIFNKLFITTHSYSSLSFDMNKFSGTWTLLYLKLFIENIMMTLVLSRISFTS